MVFKQPIKHWYLWILLSTLITVLFVSAVDVMYTKLNNQRLMHQRLVMLIHHHAWLQNHESLKRTQQRDQVDLKQALLVLTLVPGPSLTTDRPCEHGRKIRNGWIYLNSDYHNHSKKVLI